MRAIGQTDHLDIFETEEFVSDGDFCIPRRLYMAFPRNERVCHNMRPLVTALVAFMPSAREKFRTGQESPPRRVYLDRVEIAQSSVGEDGLDDLRELLPEFLAALRTHRPDIEEVAPEEFDPANLLGYLRV